VNDVQDVVELEECLVDKVAVNWFLRFAHANNLQVRLLPRPRSNTVQ
jgi:hypothetical protein